MRLEPACDDPAELQRWLDTFAAANPSMVSSNLFIQNTVHKLGAAYRPLPMQFRQPRLHAAGCCRWCDSMIVTNACSTADCLNMRPCKRGYTAALHPVNKTTFTLLHSDFK
jgi:hypothetical protein